MSRKFNLTLSFGQHLNKKLHEPIAELNLKIGWAFAILQTLFLQLKFPSLKGKELFEFITIAFLVTSSSDAMAMEEFESKRPGCLDICSSEQWKEILDILQGMLRNMLRNIQNVVQNVVQNLT